MSRAGGKRVVWLCAVATALSVSAGCRTPPRIGAEEAAATADVLAGVRAKEQLTAFMGYHRPLCFSASDGDEICEWASVEWAPGPRSLADAIGSSDRVRLLCVVPADGSARAEGSCSAYPMRSNRAAWNAVETSHPKQKRKRRAAAERNAEYWAKANRLLDEATTLVSLSRLLGQLPASCEATSSDTHQLCVWYANARTYGHGILMAAIGATRRQQVYMRCDLPIAGTAREAGSCEVLIGSRPSR